MRTIRTTLKLSLLIGLIGGFFLGFGFKLAENLFEVKVYTLLLNVDFIPGFGANIPEPIEFALHLLTSIFCAFIFVVVIQNFGSPWFWGLMLGITTAFLYIPLSLLSQQGPTLTDSISIIYWSIGHLLYGLLLAVLGCLLVKSP